MKPGNELNTAQYAREEHVILPFVCPKMCMCLNVLTSVHII